MLAEIAAVLGGATAVGTALMRLFVRHRRDKLAGRWQGESHDEYVARKIRENEELDRLARSIRGEEKKP